MASAADRLKIAKSIVNFEARRDSRGRIQIYDLPTADGGGRYEVAGINERYHPEEAAHLAQLIRAGKYDEAEAAATEIIATVTDTVSTWSTVTAVESYLRDSAFNRGNRGSGKILQMALGVDVDGVVGDDTRGALRMQEANPERLLDKLRAARERYEREVVHRDESSIFWRGLVNRWNKALDIARGFLNTHETAISTPSSMTALIETEALPEAPAEAGGRLEMGHLEAAPALSGLQSKIDYYLEALDLDAFLPINTGLSSASEPTMVSILGSPKMPLTTTDQPNRASPKVKSLRKTATVSAHVAVTGIEPAIESLSAVLGEVFKDHPDLADVLGTEGMLNVRLRKPTSGKKSKKISNHAWGTAIDFKIIGHSAPANTKDQIPRFIAVMLPVFNSHGWYSGIAFRDTMHFEVAEETIRAWSKSGKI